MEAVLENSLEATNYLVDKHFDKGYDKFQDKFQKRKKGKKGDKSYEPDRSQKPQPDTAARQLDDSSPNNRIGERTPAYPRVRSSAEFSGGAPLTGAVPPAAAGATLGATTFAAPSYPAPRRRYRNQLPSPERDIDRESRRESIRSLHQESEVSDRILRDYEREIDDPSRKPESVLPDRDLKHLKKTSSKRDSAMASGYNDNYTQGGYAAERPRSQPPRSRYYDDDDSDYDERSGRRYGKGSGRGYDDDRDYERVYEETERYRGPPANRPWDSSRRESYRSGYDEPYGAGAGAVAQYRRSDGALDRREESYVSRRSKSQGRGRDRSYSGSRSRSRSDERGGGIKEKLEDTFDVSGRGLGVGIAGAVVGGLAGREFGGKQHRQRDILLGALVGGLGANVAENKWREWKGNKEERRLDREEYEAYGGRDIGRSRSNVR